MDQDSKGRFIKGGTSYWKGKKLSKEFKDKLSKAHKKLCSEGKNIPPSRKGISPFNKGMKGFCAGSKNGMWKGRSTVTMQIRNIFEYRQWRSDIFTRDNYTCQNCETRGVYLEAHHIKMFSTILDEYNIKTVEEARLCSELWDINNGITLCKKCHDKTKKGRKRK